MAPGWNLAMEMEMASQAGRTKERGLGIVGRHTALEDPSVHWRAIWGKEGRKAFREVEHPADQASPRAVHEHILSRYGDQGSDRLARHANHLCHCYAAFAGVILPHRLQFPPCSPLRNRAAASRHFFFEVSGLSQPILLLLPLPGGPQQPPNRELRQPVWA